MPSAKVPFYFHSISAFPQAAPHIQAADRLLSYRHPPRRVPQVGYH